MRYQGNHERKHQRSISFAPTVETLVSQYARMCNISFSAAVNALLSRMIPTDPSKDSNHG